MSESLLPSLETYLSARPAGRLYHYTGVGAVLGMAETRSLRASNPYYLNDSEEIMLGCKLLLWHVGAWKAAVGEDEEFAYFIEQFKRWSESFKSVYFNIFVFCLSEHRNLLSQWRSYTPHGKGVSLGVDAPKLDEIAVLNDCVLGKCIYERDAQEALIRGIVDSVVSRFRSEREALIEMPRDGDRSGHYLSFLENYRGAFMTALCLVKHPAFNEEQEWRLISPFIDKFLEADIRFREGSSMLVPYINLRLPVADWPFAGALLGPSEHENLSMTALSMLLTQSKLCRMLENPMTPYREWRR